MKDILVHLILSLVNFLLNRAHKPEISALSLKLCYMGQNHEEKPSRQGFAVISS
jgi:hypothetical protein